MTAAALRQKKQLSTLHNGDYALSRLHRRKKHNEQRQVLRVKGGCPFHCPVCGNSPESGADRAMLFWALAQEWEFIPASEQVQSAQQNKPAFLIAGYWYHFEPRRTSPARARVELYNIIIIYLGNIRDIAGGFILPAHSGRSLSARQTAR